MSYLVLARKYRPADFTQVSGQEHVTRTLRNSVKRGKVAHAILLTGPRGVGKTSIARIFAKSLNCENGPTPDPCLKCTNCKEITQGSSLAVREIDGASHNSVDNVRELIDSFRSLPAPGYRYKVYIIDEVHMLSTAAFNALLKSLEEPPPHTVFILATTEAHRIPETVISRCQRHDLRALSAIEIEERLKEIIAAEKIDAENSVARMIARLADGSMRDAQSLLDRIQSFCEGKITGEEAGKVLGVVHRRVLFSLSEKIVNHDVQGALKLTLEAFSTGIDVSIFLREFVSHWRELLLVKHAPIESLSGIGIPAEERIELKRQVEGLPDSTLHVLVNLARQGCDIALRSSHPKYALEALVVQMAAIEEQLLAVSAGGGTTMRSASVAQVRRGTAEAASKEVQSARGVGSEGQANSASKQALEISGKNQDLDWWGFVKSVSLGGSKMLGEYIKRLSVVKFSLGRLEAVGPEFTIAALSKGDYNKKLLDALHKVFKLDKWELLLSAQEATSIAHGTSIANEEKRIEVESIAERKKSIIDHPQLKQLQKAFPGSAIEDIKVRE